MNQEQQAQSQGWIAWFSHNPVAANLLMAAILLLGFFSLSQMRTEGFPAAELRTVVIDIDYPGGSPEEIERAAVIKVENALTGLAGIEKSTATITSGSASISIKAKQGVSLQRLYSEIKVRVDAISNFPAQLEKITIKRLQEEFPVVDIQVYGDLPLTTLQHAAEKIRQQLLALDEVSKVDFQGKQSEEIAILIQPQRLDAYQLSIDDIRAAVISSSLELSAGDIKTASGHLTIANNSRGIRGEDYADIILRREDNGAVIRLADIAEVTDTFSENNILSRFDGQQAINLQIKLLGKESVIPTAEKVERLLADIRNQSWLPAQLKLEIWSNQANNVQRSLGLISGNALSGMALVLLILSLFLHHKIAFWVAVGIPISFAGAFIVMGPQYLDYSINTITTLAFIIVLGVVVDDAIVIGENIYSHNQQLQKLDRESLIQSTIRGAQQVAVPATFGVLTTVAAFYPLTMVTGEFGGPFNIIGGVTIACLLFSLIESKFILPAHLAHIRIAEQQQKRQKQQSPSVWARFRLRIDLFIQHIIQQKYRPLIDLAINHRYQSLLVFISVFVLSLGLVISGTVKVVLFGDNPANKVQAKISMEAGYSAADTYAAAEKLEHSLQQTAQQLARQYQLSEPQLQHSYSLAVTDFSAEIIAQIPTSDQRPYSSQQFLDVWQQLSGKIRGSRELSFYIDWDSSADLRLELSSHDADQLHQAQQQLTGTLAAINGLSDLRSNIDNQRVEYDLSLKPRGELLGLNNQQIIGQLRNAIYGLEAEKIQRGEDEVKVNIRYPLTERNSIASLDHLRIHIRDNHYVYLHEVCELIPRARPTRLQRIDGQRTIALTARINPSQITSAEVIQLLSATEFVRLKQAFPQVVIALAGESRAEQDAIVKLASGFILSLLLIYGLIAIPLKSYLKPVIIMMAIPFGIVGAIWGHLIVGIPISLLSFFGILALSGVVVNDSLVLVSRYNQLRQENHRYQSALVVAATSRFRAILLTSLTTFCGLFPLIMETSEEAQMLIPMAVSLAFGILFATTITLFIIPVLISIAADINNRIRKTNSAIKDQDTTPLNRLSNKRISGVSQDV